jgi:hypothetical protein
MRSEWAKNDIIGTLVDEVLLIKEELVEIKRAHNALVTEIQNTDPFEH